MKFVISLSTALIFFLFAMALLYGTYRTWQIPGKLHIRILPGISFSLGYFRLDP